MLEELPDRKEIKEAIIDLFTEEILISFWTREHCPPDKDVIHCETNEEGKHQPCLPCWKSWLSNLAGKIIDTVYARLNL